MVASSVLGDPMRPLENDLRYLVRDGAFGSSVVAEDVLAVLDRLTALEGRVAAWENRV